jgi:hypothetical protein
MATNDSHAELAKTEAAVRQLLEQVRCRFYAGHPERDFHRDRKMLLYALTWPAIWLERRGLTCPAPRYRGLLADRLAVILAHGDPARYGAYFPAYLLKCLQNWFDRYGDELYGELKHIRNALDRVLASARFAATVQRDAQHVEFLAATHRLIRAQRDHPRATDERQLPLF